MARLELPARNRTRISYIGAFALIAIEGAWIISGSNILVSERQTDNLIVEGDYIIAASTYKSSYGIARPVKMTICRYWTGVRLKDVPGFEPHCPTYWRSR